MSFVFPLLLGGVLLAGIPVLLHLIMRQQPKHVRFPTLRFLRELHKRNQRKLQLRHLLLLALRLFLIIAICLALARPRLFSERLGLASERPVAAVLLFDNSPSMGYVVAGKTRLDVSRERARELLGQLPEGSRIAIVTTGEPGGAWEATAALAQERLGKVEIRYANSRITDRLGDAYRLFSDLDQEAETTEEAMPRFLYVFSDAANACWDAGRHKDLKLVQERQRLPVRAVFVDVSAEQPGDVALLNLDLPRQAVPLSDNEGVAINVTVHAIGQSLETDLLCFIDNDKISQRKAIKLEAGQSKTETFRQKGLVAGWHQAEIRLASSDSLKFNNALFATFEVRGGRPVLLVADNPADSLVLKYALEHDFQCKEMKPDELITRPPAEIDAYRAIWLVGVRKPSINLWEFLRRYVAQGGGLVIAPGGDGFDRTAYEETEAARALMPGRFVRPVETGKKEGVRWREDNLQHPFLRDYRDEKMQPNSVIQRIPPEARRYWEAQVDPERGHVIIAYADKENRPAILERLFNAKTVKGRVILLTVPMDVRNRSWTNYLTNDFLEYLAAITTDYLAGDTDEARFNFLTGQSVTVSLPSSTRFPTYALQGRGLMESDIVVHRAENQTELVLNQAITPGNYSLLIGSSQKVTCFSMNVANEESDLGKVPAEQIEDLFGKDSILPVGTTLSLKDAVQSHWAQPVELFPWLMILLLLVLAVENLLANKFYRHDAQRQQTRVVAQPRSEDALAGRAS